MNSLAPIASRIASIESRFRTVGEPSDGLVVLGSTHEFDPFGEVYAQALAASEPARRAAATEPFNAPAAYRPVAASAGLAGAPSGVYPSAVTAAAAGGGPSPEQVSAAIAGQAALPGVRPPGGYGPMPVPAELVGFGNGHVPASALQPLSTQPNHRLAAPAAAAWDAAVRAAAAEGITLRITDSYREYAEQVDLAERKGLYSQGGLAATPGTSNHGWGLAVDADVTDPATLRWLRLNGPRFGFVETSDREPWHWEFRPHQV